MTLKFYQSPFHATHGQNIANKMAAKMDLSIMLSKLIDDKGWTQSEAAEFFGITQSRISNLKNAKIEKFTLDSMMDMLEKLDFRINFSMPSLNEASISIQKRHIAA